jgi:hypothetical protein
MSIANELLDKIARINRNNLEPEAILHVEELALQIQQFEVARERGEDPAVKRLLDMYRTRVRDLNMRLQSETSETLPDRDRDRLIDRKGIFEQFIQSFDSASVDAELERIAKDVDYYLV